MPLVAGVDSSTTGCKVEVRDAATGELVASGRAPHPATNPPRSEQHPDAWWSAFEAAAAEADLDGHHRPAAIAVAAQQHGLVVLDHGGDVLRPAKLWNDTESAEDAAALVDALGPGGWAEACGSVPVPSFTITKLRWLRRNEPDAFRRIGRVLLPHDWLTHRLTGRWTTDRGDASGTGWWSPAEERYRTDLLALVDEATAWDDVLPEVVGPADAAGEWNGALVAPGTGDNMAAALGLGLGVGDLGLSLGTSGTAFCTSGSATADPTGIVAGFADATGRYLPLVCTLNATKVTDAIGRLLGVSVEQLDALAADAQPGASGVVVVPYFDGERTPNLPDATGAIVGLRSDVAREDLARASFEGVVANVLAGAAHLPSPFERVVLVGGGARSTVYQQVVADLSGCRVFVPDAGELVARGAALQAAAVLTTTSFDAVAEAWRLSGTSVEPDPSVDGESIRAHYAAAAAGGVEQG